MGLLLLLFSLNAFASFEILQVDNKFTASAADIRAVLSSAAAQVIEFFPNRNIRVNVVHRDGGPIVYFEKGDNGAYNVGLSVEGNRWDQFSFQFSHELCHIVSNFENGKGDQYQWFEEVIGEMCSLFTLRRMAEVWKTTPPYPNWKDYSHSLSKYAEDRIQSYPMPQGMSLFSFLEKIKLTLSNADWNRGNHITVASELLPLLEKNPSEILAIQSLNDSDLLEQKSFTDFIAAWSRKNPQNNFVSKTQGLIYGNFKIAIK